MVKMFGWEQKLSEFIGEKRKVELDWHFKTKIYTLFTIGFQCVAADVSDSALPYK